MTCSDTLTVDNIKDHLVNDTKIKVAAVDIDGVLRGKVMHKDKFLSIVEGGFGFCSVIFGWDLHDKAYSTKLEFGGSDYDFGDLLAKVDLASYRRIPWEDNIPFFLLYLFHPQTKKPLYCDSRSVLKQVTDDFGEMGLVPYSGVEFEFFCFKETLESLSEKGHSQLKPLTLGMAGYSLIRPLQNQDFYYHAFDWLKEFKVDVESWHTETGPGVFEAAVAYTTSKESGDRATLFKTSMKQIGYKHGVMPSFMAKPYGDLPGCSGHMHFSLKDKRGNNVFATGEMSEQYPTMSKIMVYFLAGVLHGLPSILAILAPTINSYKRLVENFWAPVSVSWGMDSRHCAVRVIAPPSTSASATRMEMRVSGADINPHLALAAVLKCGYWGIKTQQQLPCVPQVGTNSKDNTPLARTLQEATVEMDQKDSVARKVLGDEFVNHYVATRKHEWNLWQNAVTDYELKRYMELI